MPALDDCFVSVTPVVVTKDSLHVQLAIDPRLYKRDWDHIFQGEQMRLEGDLSVQTAFNDTEF